MLLANQGSVSSALSSDSHVELPGTGHSPAYPADNTCSPSITIRSSSPTEKDGNQVKASNQNHPDSEFINKDATNKLPIAHDLKGNDASKDDGTLTSGFNPVVDLSKSDPADLTTNGVGKRQSVPTTTTSKALTVSLVAVCNPSKRILLCSIYGLFFLIEFLHEC